MGKNLEIRILEANVVLGDKATKKGDVVDVERNHAEALVSAGRASFTCRVRALKDGLLNNYRVHSAGDVFEVCPEHAAMLYGQGAVEVLDRAKIPVELWKDAPPKRPAVKPADAAPHFSADDPAIQIKLTEACFFGSTHHPAGTVLEVSRLQSKRFIEAGKATLTASAAAAAAVRDVASTLISSVG